MSVSYEARRYAVFSSPLTFHPSSVQIFWTPRFQTLLVYAAPLNVFMTEFLIT
jgi:hypothetical protein